jgi:hypothetical protein
MGYEKVNLSKAEKWFSHALVGRCVEKPGYRTDLEQLVIQDSKAVSLPSPELVRSCMQGFFKRPDK